MKDENVQDYGENYNETDEPGYPVDYKYAGFWIRFLSFLIDFLLFLNIATVYTWISFYVSANTLLKGGFIIPLLSTAFLLFVFVLYLSCRLLIIWKFGITLGKKILGLKIVSEEDDKLSLYKVLMREIAGKTISSVIIMAGFVMAGFSDKKQALHDKIAKTIVVFNGPETKLNRLALAVGLLIIEVILVAGNSCILYKSVLNIEDTSIKKGVSEAIIQIANIKKEFGYISQYKPTFGTDPSVAKLCGYTPEEYNPVVNISPDGKQMAVFARVCRNKEKYFCSDLSSDPDKIVEVDKNYALSGKTICFGILSDTNTASSAQNNVEEDLNKTEQRIVSQDNTKLGLLNNSEMLEIVNSATNRAIKWKDDSRLISFNFLVALDSDGNPESTPREYRVVFTSASDPSEAYGMVFNENGLIVKENKASLNDRDLPSLNLEQRNMIGHVSPEELKISMKDAFSIAKSYLEGKKPSVNMASSDLDLGVMFIKGFGYVWSFSLDRDKKTVCDVIINAKTGEIIESHYY